MAKMEEYTDHLRFPLDGTMTEEQFLNWFHGDFGVCGCGDPQTTIDLLHRTLNAMKDGPNMDAVMAVLRYELLVKENIEGFFGAFLGMLDNAGLIEHGVSIRCSWLTEKGKAVLAFLDRFPEPDEQNCIWNK